MTNATVFADAIYDLCLAQPNKKKQGARSAPVLALVLYQVYTLFYVFLVPLLPGQRRRVGLFLKRRQPFYNCNPRFGKILGVSVECFCSSEGVIGCDHLESARVEPTASASWTHLERQG